MTKKDQKPDITFGHIWKKLNSVSCAELAKEKNNLTYLPWNEAWHLLMSHYPDATFGFLDNEVYPDGSVSVVCQVEIHGFVRRMWLPVMNYSNKVVINPSSRDISDNKMRCLVKTIAMFGLGFHIYRGQVQPEDMFDDSSPEQVKGNKNTTTTGSQNTAVGHKPTNKKSVNVTKEVADKMTEEKKKKDEEEFYLSWTDDDAQFWVDKMVEVAKKFPESEGGLRNQWSANKKTIAHLTENHKDAYESLKNQFTEIRNSLNEKKEGNDE